MRVDADPSTLDPAQVEALDHLLDELLDLPVSERLRDLASRPAMDAHVRAEAARLLRGDVDAVLSKALRREPAQRYATVHALKEDVERFLRGDPVMARSGARRSWRWEIST